MARTVARPTGNVRTTGVPRRAVLSSAVGALTLGVGLPAVAGGARHRPTSAGGLVVAAPQPPPMWPENLALSWQLVRLLAASVGEGADPTEVLQVANRVGTEPSFDRWVDELTALAHDLLDQSEDTPKADYRTARHLRLRASNYLRAAEYGILPTTENLPAKVDLFRQSREAFLAAVERGAPRVRDVRIPFEDTELYAYLVEPVRPTKRRRAVVFFGGLDSTSEELYVRAASQLAQRSILVLIVDGPGIGATLRLAGLPSRYDYEVVASAAYDYVAARDDVDPDRVGLMGVSLGGYYAARSFAYEHRFRTGVIWGAMYDAAGDDTAATSEDAETSRRTVQQALWVIGGNDAGRLAEQLPRFNLEGQLERLRTPVLVLHGADDTVVSKAHADRLWRELPGGVRRRSRYVEVASGRPGATHCQADSLPVAWGEIMPWFQETL